MERGLNNDEPWRIMKVEGLIYYWPFSKAAKVYVLLKMSINYTNLYYNPKTIQKLF